MINLLGPSLVRITNYSTELMKQEKWKASEISEPFSRLSIDTQIIDEYDHLQLFCDGSENKNNTSRFLILGTGKAIISHNQ